MRNMGQQTLSALAILTLVGLAVLPVVASAVGDCPMAVADTCLLGGPDHSCCPSSELDGRSQSSLTCCRSSLPAAETPMASPRLEKDGGDVEPPGAGVVGGGGIERRHIVRSQEHAPLSSLFSIHCVYRI